MFHKALQHVYPRVHCMISYIIRIRKSKDRQQNGQKKKYKRTNNDLQNTTHKTKDQVTRAPIKTHMFHKALQHVYPRVHCMISYIFFST
jgi:hypothetical protein